MKALGVIIIIAAVALGLMVSLPWFISLLLWFWNFNPVFCFLFGWEISALAFIPAFVIGALGAWVYDKGEEQEKERFERYISDRDK